MEKIQLTKEGKGQLLYKKAKTLIPGGGQLLSKRPERFLPEYWPAYYDRAKGCEIWDLDGNKFIDMESMGIGACILGYADEEVNDAVKKAMDKGSMCSLMVPEEVELAELLLDLHPWAEMVRYAKGGGDAMAVAVRIARAATKKDIILFSGYHGWHDWYISANLADNKALDGQLLPGLSPVGVARELKGTSKPFFYNNKEEFLDLIHKYGDQIGGVVLEAARNMTPETDFFEVIETETKRLGVPLIVDEVTSGFRMCCGGAHMYFNIHPDMAVFAKGIANGYPMAAIIGKKKFMDAAQDSFISSTFWTERVGFAAAIAAIKKYKRLNVQDHLIHCGKRVQEGWKVLANKHGLKVHISGIYPLSHISFDFKPMESRTLLCQELVRRGYIACDAYYSSLAHNDAIIDEYLKAVDEAFAILAEATKNDSFDKYLLGPVSQTGFKRLA